MCRANNARKIGFPPFFQPPRPPPSLFAHPPTPTHLSPCHYFNSATPNNFSSIFSFSIHSTRFTFDALYALRVYMGVYSYVLCANIRRLPTSRPFLLDGTPCTHVRYDRVLEKTLCPNSSHIYYIHERRLYLHIPIVCHIAILLNSKFFDNLFFQLPPFTISVQSSLGIRLHFHLQ